MLLLVGARRDPVAKVAWASNQGSTPVLEYVSLGLLLSSSYACRREEHQCRFTRFKDV